MRAAAALMLALGSMASPALAQAIDWSASAEVSSDQRLRGISWTGGEVGARFDLGLTHSSGVQAGASLLTVRGWGGRGGADAAADLFLGYRAPLGAGTASGGLLWRSFPGGSGDYAEMFAGLDGTLGPAQLRLSANYAPDQSAIGGSSLYVRAGTRIALIGTPATLSGHIGQAWGPEPAADRRFSLTPAGDYRDWRLGIDIAAGPATLGLAYVDSDIAGNAARAAGLRRGDTAGTLVASLAIGF